MGGAPAISDRSGPQAFAARAGTATEAQRNRDGDRNPGWDNENGGAETVRRGNAQRIAGKARSARVRHTIATPTPLPVETIPDATPCSRSAEQQEPAERHRIRADDQLQRLRRIAQRAANLRQRHDDDVLIERDDQHRERQQRQRRRFPRPIDRRSSAWCVDERRARRSSTNQSITIRYVI